VAFDGCESAHDAAISIAHCGRDGVVVSGLDRFKSAQSSAGSGFQAALDEIRSGEKTGHWIWYVFPQLAGLGSSSTSHAFAIADAAEAAAFLRDPALASRLLTIATAVAEQLTAGTRRSLLRLMGSDTDVRKLVSSLTLFGHVARSLQQTDGLEIHRSIAGVAEAILAIAAAQGYPACAYTIRHLGPTVD
jgi:uncharacterized protein (DUF1810 family)